MRHIAESAAVLLDWLRLAPRNHDFAPAEESSFCRVCGAPASLHEERP